MKYEEAIKNNIEKFECDGVEMRSIVLPRFLESFAVLACLMAEDLCERDFSYVTIGKERNINGKSKKNPTLKDILSVICGNDFPRSAKFTQLLSEFWDWLLEQEVSEDFDREKGVWYDYTHTIDKWNEFSRSRE